MKALIALALLVHPSAFALNAESWEVTEIAVHASTLTRADGRRTELPRSEEVLLALNFATVNAHGSPEYRKIKAQSVSGNRIALEIESAAEKDCRRDGGASFAVIAPHHANLGVVVKPGHYDLVINGDVLGELNVSENNAQLKPNPGYAAAVASRYTREFSATFGELSGIEVKGEDCHARLEIRGGKLLAHYHFSGSQETLSNGDVLTRKEINETLELSFRTRWECPRSNGGPITWRAEFSGPDDEQALIVRQRQSDYTFRLRDRYCSK